MRTRIDCEPSADIGAADTPATRHTEIPIFILVFGCHHLIIFSITTDSAYGTKHTEQIPPFIIQIQILLVIVYRIFAGKCWQSALHLFPPTRASSRAHDFGWARAHSHLTPTRDESLFKTKNEENVWNSITWMSNTGNTQCTQARKSRATRISIQQRQ